MLFNDGIKRAQKHLHPYLAGNFAPIQKVLPLTPCTYTGSIPQELVGGEYIRNGGNPLSNEDLGRDAHWFDGDGMLSGVLFKRNGKDGITPEFVNQYILTDVYLQSRSSPNLKTPILPSIATLINPLNSIWMICLAVFRTLALVFLSHLPGSVQSIKKISVANTSIFWHDGRALATCESGPPIRIQLPDLQTVGWFNGRRAQGEIEEDSRSGYGGGGITGFMYEWTTGHPKVDPDTKELITFHCTFIPPYINYSIVPSTQSYPGKAPLLEPEAKLTISVPGVSGAKMMHDFGVSKSHTIIMDLPLSLDPMNLARGKPVVAYDPTGVSRFGVFPRYNPEQIYWYETNPCCIFHTANTWETTSKSSTGFLEQTSVNLLTCRLTSASLIFSAGDIASPEPMKPIPIEYQEEEQCRLYYYSFSLPSDLSDIRQITHQWALSAIPFEFPTLREDKAMRSARYIYGCSNTQTFTAALGRAVKIDYLAKVNVEELIARGLANPPEQIKGCVDNRTVEEVRASDDPNDPIQLFTLPKGWYAQEPRFVPRKNSASEDDGWLLTYVFDESQLDRITGEAPSNASSELWIIDARNMKDVIARIHLPQRVPYGLHGNWFSEDMLTSQRSVGTYRVESEILQQRKRLQVGGIFWTTWMGVRSGLERWIA